MLHVVDRRCCLQTTCLFLLFVPQLGKNDVVHGWFLVDKVKMVPNICRTEEIVEDGGAAN